MGSFVSPKKTMDIEATQTEAMKIMTDAKMLLEKLAWKSR